MVEIKRLDYITEYCCSVCGLPWCCYTDAVACEQKHQIQMRTRGGTEGHEGPKLGQRSGPAAEPRWPAGQGVRCPPQEVDP